LSLACGFTGNLFLLLNFTGRVRYILALPLSVVFWMLASTIVSLLKDNVPAMAVEMETDRVQLIAITISMHIYAPPISPGETYSQGFWHAVLASILYFLGGFILLINMLGYSLGHYPQHFELDDDQRTLILQTMMYFFWLAGGAGVFVKLEGWSFSNA